MNDGCRLRREDRQAVVDGVGQGTVSGDGEEGAVAEGEEGSLSHRRIIVFEG